MDGGTSGRVFTIPPARPFLETLARAILAGDLSVPGSGPLALVDVTVLLPTRRAVTALENALLDAAPAKALLLPRIRPIVNDEDDLSLIAALADTTTDDSDIPPAMPEVERRLTLTRLVLAWADAKRREDQPDTSRAAVRRDVMADRPAKAVKLAADLARLMDLVEREDASLNGLDGLVSGEFSEHWREVAAFLGIVTRAWPAILAERGMISAAARRNRLMRAEARRLQEARAPRPVIVAGVTTATPAAAELIGAVLASPMGAVVLPALDQHLDPESWNAIVPDHPEHPQFGMAKLLRRLGVEREAVKTLPGLETPARDRARAAFASEALRPAATTEKWRLAASPERDGVATALAGVSLIEAPTSQDEAEAAALILRHAAETPGRTAALVTPDRALARRVAARLSAWDIAAGGSNDAVLATTSEGGFLDLVLGAAANAFAPGNLVALVNHPLFRVGLDDEAVTVATRTLEIAAFRAPYIGRGLRGVQAALDRAAHDVATYQRRHVALTRLSEDAWGGARDLVARLSSAFEPLAETLAGSRRQPLRVFAAAHMQTAEALARPPEEDAGLNGKGHVPWTTDAGQAARALLDAMVGETQSALAIDGVDYADLYRVLAAGETVRERRARHGRIFIWSPVEARLGQADVLVLGSLNDGTWPEAADAGPWLNRPMLKTLGLPAPEERVGHAAHDFTCLLGAPRVYLTRAEKVDGAPTVPSRWLMRLKALLDAHGAADALAPDEPWLAWARGRDHVEKRVRLDPPAPCPPVALRPRKISVSNVESWIANPYSVFARDILKLEALDDLGLPPGPRIQGTIIHGALSRFSKKFAGELPAEIARELMALARGALRANADDPRVAAFWLPRFERFALWFGETEPGRRRECEGCATEVSGELSFDAPAGLFVLTARADRIDVSAGSLVITDYKLSADVKRLASRAANGVAPQLLLEAAIARTTGFVGVEPRAVRALRYISTAGGEPPGDEQEVKCADVAALSAAALDGFKRLVASYDDRATPYRAMRRARFESAFDDYAHLARTAEWAGRANGEGAV